MTTSQVENVLDEVSGAQSSLSQGETPGKVLVAASPVSTTIAQTVVVLAWLSMPKAIDYFDMAPPARPVWRTDCRLWCGTFRAACRDLSRAGGRETPMRFSSRYIAFPPDSTAFDGGSGTPR